MSILWAGGEDLDFAQGSVLPQSQNISTAAGHFRAGYARCGIGTSISGSASAVFLSVPWAGGAVTSCWLGFWIAQALPATAFKTHNLIAGLAQSGATGSGIYLMTDNASGEKLAIGTYLASGPTIVQLASEVGTSLTSGAMLKLDIQIVNYGAAGTINVFSNGILIMTYTGDIRVTGVTGFDTTATAGMGSTPGNQNWNSEFVVADEDTRTFALRTLAVSGAGDTDAWTGAYTDVNEIVLNDATLVTTNIVAFDEEFVLGSLPAGLFQVRAIQLVARSSNASGTATDIAIGVRTAGATFPGTPQSLTTNWVALQSLLATNPNTSAPWVSSDVNALQINLRSS